MPPPSPAGLPAQHQHVHGLGVVVVHRLAVALVNVSVLEVAA